MSRVIRSEYSGRSVAMKIFRVFVLFLLAGSDAVTGLMKWKTRSPITVADIVELEANTRGFDDFQKTLAAEFDDTIRMGGQTTIRVASSVRCALGHLATKLLTSCYAYINRLWNEYCGLAIRMVSARNTDHPDVRESIRFRDDRLYCPLTAFYDAEIRFHWLFVIASLLLTIDSDRDAQRQLRNVCPALVEPAEALQSEITAAEFVELDSRLKDVKRKLVDFSDAFCTRWRPLLSHRVVTTTALENIRNNSPFIDYVFCDVGCTVNFKLSRESDRREYQMDSWKCEDILKTQEYGLSKYEEDVSMKTVSSTSPPKSKSISSRRLFLGNKYSIATLIIKLKSNSHYMNVMQYYNVVAHVLLLESIQEGYKIFRGTKHMVEKRCDNKTQQRKAVDVFRGLKSTLSAFKAVFDELVFTIRDKKRVDLTNNEQKKTFDQQAKFLVQLLNIREGRDEYYQIELICLKIPEVVTNAFKDAHLGDNPNDTIFRAYYFTAPILRVNRLYRFVADDF